MASQYPYYSANTPVVVQGMDVGSAMPVSPFNHPEQHDWNKREPQPKRCNDAFFALLFYAHLAAMAWTASNYAPMMLDDLAENNGNRNRMLLEAESLVSRAMSWRRSLQEEQGDDTIPVDMDAVLFILGITGLAGFIISAFTLTFMMYFAAGLIKFALWFNIIVSLVVAILGLVSGVIPIAILGFLVFAWNAYYAYVVWSRIPFAASNMVTAITAVRANFGLTFFAYSSLVVSFGWSVWWSVAAISSLFVTNGCNADGECETEFNGFIVFLFLISYYWTSEVIKNTLHVTVAGTVGTWWFAPSEASSCCSKAVRDSFVRSITYSFGSICLGSLIVAIIQAVKEMLHQLRDSDDGMLLCCAECLLGCIESLVEYFNQWAFVFVGLYGYSFMEAGMNVMALFRSRGWTTIITDMLVTSVLMMVSIGVGCLTGIIGVLVAQGANLDLGDGTAGIAFFIGFMIGCVLCATLFSVVSSAVNTVIVCYAEAPNEFQANHPRLSENMRQSWRQAWPMEFRY